MRQIILFLGVMALSFGAFSATYSYEQLNRKAPDPLGLTHSQLLIPEMNIQRFDRKVAYRNVVEMIQGQVPGVMVTGGPVHYRIRIRNSNRPPTIVLDGQVLPSLGDNGVNTVLLSIDPSSVEQIRINKSQGGTGAYLPTAGDTVIDLTRGK